MCGRYAAGKHTDELVEEFEVAADLTGEPVRSLLKGPQEPPAGQPDFNVAPTKAARVVLDRGERQLRLLSWGLVPFWAKHPGAAARLINARAEEVMTKRAFAAAVRSRRCLVPASGWFEWQVSPHAVDAKGRPRKQPFFMSLPDGSSLALAGLYEYWRDPGSAADDPTAWLGTFTVLTTEADPELMLVHDRMPLVLPPRTWSDWLDAGSTPERVLPLLGYRSPGRFRSYPVTGEVGSNRCNGAGLVRPIEVSAADGVVDPATGWPWGRAGDGRIGRLAAEP